MAIEKLFRQLASRCLDAGLESDAESLADALWLAQFQPVPLHEAMQDADLKAEISQSENTSESASALAGTPMDSVDLSTKPSGSVHPSISKAQSIANPNTTGLFNHAGAEASNRRASPIKVPATTALPESRNIARALRPFNRRQMSPHRVLLDEEASAEYIAHFGFVRPVFRPAPEPWFDIALVIDTARSMDVWIKTIAEFEQLLSVHGAFRQVRRWRLLTGGSIQLESANGQKLKPSVLHDPRGRTLVLIVTNGVAAFWNNGDMARILGDWSRHAPVAIMQLFSERQWPHTELGPASRQVRSLVPGTANTQLQIERKRWESSTVNDNLIAVPILSFAPESIARWAKTTMAMGTESTPAVIFVSIEEAVYSAGYELDSDTPPLSPRARVDNFRSIASKEAFRLALYLAAVPLTLPIMRIVQQQILPNPKIEQLAEVLASGLIERLTPADAQTDPDNVVYDFPEDIRDLLFGALRTSKAVEIRSLVQAQLKDFIEQRIGHSIESFQAFVLDEHGQFDLPADARAFVEIERELLKELGVYHKSSAGSIASEHQKNASNLAPMVYLVDSDFSIRDSLTLLIEPTGQTVKSFESPEAFLNGYNSKQPGCLLLETRFPSPLMNGLDLQNELSNRGINIPIIFISATANISESARAFRAGALDFLDKPIDSGLLLERINEAIKKDIEFRDALVKKQRIQDRIDHLTAREKEVLNLIVKSYSNKESAKILNISSRSLDVHRASIMEKMQADNVAKLITMVMYCADTQASSRESITINPGFSNEEESVASITAFPSSSLITSANSITPIQMPVSSDYAFRSSAGLGRLVSNIFWGREAELKLLWQVLNDSDMPDKGGSALIVGIRRMGRTSLKERFLYETQQFQPHRLCLSFNFEGYSELNGSSSARLERWFMQELGRLLARQGMPFHFNWPIAYRDNFKWRHRTRKQLHDHLAKIKARTGHTVLFSFDETEHLVAADAKNDFEIFRLLRSLIQEGLICLIATSYPYSAYSKFSLHALSHDDSSPVFNLLTHVLYLRAWTPDECWGFINTRLADLGVTLPDSYRNELLHLTRGIPWLTQVLGQKISQLLEIGQVNNIVTDSIWLATKNRVLTDLHEELKYSIESIAQNEEVSFPEIAATNLSNGQLWKALVALADKQGCPSLSNNRDWPAPIEFSVAELLDFLPDVNEGSLRRVLSRLTALPVIECVNFDDNRYCFSNNLLPMWRQSSSEEFGYGELTVPQFVAKGVGESKEEWITILVKQLQQYAESKENKLLNGDYDILQINDVSHGMAKRYSANILLRKNIQKTDILYIINKVTEKLKTEDHYRDDIVRKRWISKEAHVIWLYLYFSIKDIRQVNWICRTNWISKTLPPENSPVKFGGENIGDGIFVDWNKQHENYDSLMFSNIQLNIENNTQPLNLVRAIFIGYGGAGKTSLIRTLQYEPLDEGRENMTAGIDVSDWPVPNSEIKAQFWDFDGQVMMHATHQFFLREHCLYVLVLNARSEINSTEQAEYWLEHVKAFGNYAPVMIVGNKADQSAINLDMRYLKDKYPNVVDFYPLSCTQAMTSFKAVFDRFKQDFCQQLRQLGTHQVLFTQEQFGVIEELCQYSLRAAFITHREFDDICERHGITDKGVSNREWLLNILDKLGIIIYFPQLSFLDEYILNPRWLTHGVYTLMHEQKARLTEADAFAILNNKPVRDENGHSLDYPKDKCRFILEVMQEFKLCYPLAQQRNTFIIPDLLPSYRPKSIPFEKSGALAFEFRFISFLPRNIMMELIVTCYQEIVDEIVWQNGVLLKHQSLKTQALLEVSYHERLINIWVQGHDAKYYLAVLNAEVLKILGRLTDLSYEEYVELPVLARIDQTKMINFSEKADYRQLLDFVRNGSYIYPTKHNSYDLRIVLGLIMPDAELSRIGINIKQFFSDDEVSKNIESGFSRLIESKAAPEVQQLLKQLLNEIKVLNAKAPKDRAQDVEVLADCTVALIDESNRELPRELWYQLILKDIKDTALIFKGLGKPTIKIIEKLSKLLLS